MKRIVVLIPLVMICILSFAKTPAISLMERYAEVKGMRMMEVTGSKMVFAKPILRKHTIGPMTESVQEVYFLALKKPSVQDKDRFMNDMTHMLKEYRYYGKSGSPNGDVDVYVHLKTDDCVDELVIYNPQMYTLYSLIGIFPVRELLSLTPVTDPIN